MHLLDSLEILWCVEAAPLLLVASAGATEKSNAASAYPQPLKLTSLSVHSLELF